MKKTEDKMNTDDAGEVGVVFPQVFKYKKEEIYTEFLTDRGTGEEKEAVEELKEFYKYSQIYH